MSFFSRQKRVKTLLISIFISLFFFYILTSKNSINLNSNSNKDDKTISLQYFNQLSNSVFEYSKNFKFNDEIDDSKKINQDNEQQKNLQLSRPSSTPEDSENIVNLYFKTDHTGSIKGGSTGNTKNPVEKSLEELLETNDKDTDDNKSENNDKNDKNDNNNNKDKSSSSSSSSSSNKKLSESDDRKELPLTENQSPTMEKLNKVRSEDIIKGDVIFQNYFAEIFELLKRNKMNYPVKERLTLKNGKPKIENVLFYAQTYDRISENDVSHFMSFTPQLINDLSLKHEYVTSNLPQEVPKGFYKGNGYVIVGGGKYSWFALLGIETLRKVGSKLPVEVILPDTEDYEFEFCDQILPSLNARCVEMNTVFGKQNLKRFDIAGYQYKSFALLASTFENAYLLDSDTFPVNNPDDLFESDLYKNYHMITFPDFWRRTTSPLYYKIAGIPVGDKQVRHLNDFWTNPKYYWTKDNEVPYHGFPYHDREGTLPDWTTESGEMLINKNFHYKTLLLSLYYNNDGPYGYYPLLSQGGAGEGDKETFVAAAHYYRLPYYQVYKLPERAFGWYNEDHNYEHSSIVQYNPLIDYEVLQEAKKKISQDIKNAEESNKKFEYSYDNYFGSKFFTAENSQPLFYHVHDPKMDPFQIQTKGFTFNLDNKKIRNLGDEFPQFNFDLEKFIWSSINHYICDEKIKFKCFEKYNYNDICGDWMKSQLEFLESTSKELFKNYEKENKNQDKKFKEQLEEIKKKIGKDDSSAIIDSKAEAEKKEKEIKEKEIKEKEIKEKEIKDKEIKDKEIKDKDSKDKVTKVTKDSKDTKGKDTKDSKDSKEKMEADLAAVKAAAVNAAAAAEAAAKAGKSNEKKD
ncbi:transferase activity, transferring glycosyl groups protein [[Candida] boidinii]|nr:transferase activity, transferring glycosyl groups protein [[Candida] boidinii]